MKEGSIINEKSVEGNFAGWMFGFVALAIGVINIFWGNDRGYGVFIFLLAFIYFPPPNAILKTSTGLSIHIILKLLIGVFIIWSATGVGELFDKIDLMVRDIQ